MDAKEIFENYPYHAAGYLLRVTPVSSENFTFRDQLMQLSTWIIQPERIGKFHLDDAAVEAAAEDLDFTDELIFLAATILIDFIDGLDEVERLHWRPLYEELKERINEK